MKNSQYKTYRPLFLTAVGSTAYGTTVDGSDEDLGGIVLPKADALLGFTKFEQDDQFFDESGEKIDQTMYTLVKGVQLIKENNPNMMDYLWMPDRCIKTLTSEWERYLEIRDEFISRKCYYRYQRYAVSQIDRLEVHQKYLAYEREPSKPVRSDYGLPDVSVFPPTSSDAITRIGSEYMGEEEVKAFYHEFNQWFQSEGTLIFKKHVPIQYHTLAIEDYKRTMVPFLGLIGTLGKTYLKEEYQDMARKEMVFRAATEDFKRYSKWKKGRNPKRMALEKKVGFDCKHAAHAIRLLRTGNEILEGKGVNVDRTGIDAEELVKLRLGDTSFEEFNQMVEFEKTRSKSALDNTTLQLSPNNELIDSITMDILQKEIAINH